MNVLCTPAIEETEETEEDEKAIGQMKLQDSHQIPYRVVAEYEVIAYPVLYICVLLGIFYLTITRAMRRDTTRQLPLPVTMSLALILLLIP